MSKDTNDRLHWGWVLTATLFFGAAFGLGRMVGGLPAPVPDELRTADASPLHEDKRYKIPVSMSQPTRGPADALVTLVEWCDLSGAACRGADEMVTSLLHEYKGNLRHVWRHFPAQSTPDVLMAHELAHTVNEQQGKFWELRALLLKQDVTLTRADTDGAVASLGLDSQGLQASLTKHSFAGYVMADSMFAAKFGVTQGPTFFVNGHRLLSAPTRARLKSLIEQELTTAQTMVDSGIPRDKVYEEITKEGLWKVAGTP